MTTIPTQSRPVSLTLILSGHTRNKSKIVTTVSNSSNCLLLAGELLIFASRKEVTDGHGVSVTWLFDVDRTLARISDGYSSEFTRICATINSRLS